jgi:hypothetical protein
VALSTRWYAGGRRCRKPIRITSRQNGRAVEAIVVDECDSSSGCRDNVVDASELGRVEGARAQQQRRRCEHITWSGRRARMHTDR